MKYQRLPNRLISSEDTALASMLVVLQTRNTFHLQELPVIGSVWPAGNDLIDLVLAGDLRQRIRDRRVHVAIDDVDLVAVDQLQRLLHAGPDIVGRILDQQIRLAAENAAVLVDLRHRVFGALHLGLRQRRQHAGQRVDEAELYRLLAARIYYRWGRQRDRPQRCASLHKVYAGPERACSCLPFRHLPLCRTRLHRHELLPRHADNARTGPPSRPHLYRQQASFAASPRTPSRPAGRRDTIRPQPRRRLRWPD